jgi:hypothetical protein
VETGLLSPFTITATYSGDSAYVSSSVSLTNARGSSTSPTGTAFAQLDQTTAAATGLGTVNILQYQSDPVSQPTFTASGVYFDVAASTGNSFASEILQSCNLRGGTSFEWWNSSANGNAGGWQPVIGDPGPSFTLGDPACVSVTLDGTSSPTIAQLSGTVFGVAGGTIAPVITSPSRLVVGSGTQISQTISTLGSPTPVISESGSLPPGITFSDRHDGTALLSGSLPAKKTGTYTLTISSTNTAGTAHQTFTLVVAKPTKPKIISTKKLAFLTGETVADTITATGFPSPTVTEAGALPPGLAWNVVGAGTATITGSPQVAGTFKVTVTASSSAGSVTQVVQITVYAGL